MPGRSRETPPAASPSAARPAALSPAPLPALPAVVPPWPGSQVPVRDGEVFVRHTLPSAAGRNSGTGAEQPERALYVHGLGGSSTNWTDLAALLAGRLEGWALDLPGFGRSQPPPRGGYALQRQVRTVVDVLEWIAARPGAGEGRPVHLLGNSLGGLLTLFVAARRPELIATLTLVSPAMPVYRMPQGMNPAVPLLLLPGAPSLAERRLAGISPEEHVRALIAACFGDPQRVPPQRWELAVEEMRERGEQTWANRALALSMRGLLTSYFRVGRSHAWRLAREVQCPTLVVWGDRDRLVDPRLAPRLAEALPDARLLMLDGVGHLPMVEAPEPTARAVLALVEEAGRTAGTAVDPGARAGR